MLGWFVAAGFASVRWLRVAQREHYLTRAVLQFDQRWWTGTSLNVALRALVVGSIVASLMGYWYAAFIAFAIVCIGPIGLSLRGRTSKLQWTRRLRTVAAVEALLVMLFTLFVVVAANDLALLAVPLALAALALPLFLEASLWITKPIEARVANRYVRDAKAKLRRTSPQVVGITGSYGKTGTKGYVAHFLAETTTVVASPASFNNLMGLCRTINEYVQHDTRVLIAEMGTYGKGEIAQLCELCPPDVAVITAIGPVHLERFKTEAAIVEAKAEIFAHARACVLNVDDDRLAELADRLRADGKLVKRVSANDRHADVLVATLDGRDLEVYVEGSPLGVLHNCDAPPTNVGCAIAAALECGANRESLARRCALPLPVAAHRQVVSTLPNGVTVIDDTFNANPASVRKGIALLRSLADERNATRRVVVTPGMVELGDRQAIENESLGAAIGVVATDLVIVGRTNAHALRRGAAQTAVNIHSARVLSDAVAWVRENARAGDVIFYANDLPDHFA